MSAAHGARSLSWRDAGARRQKRDEQRDDEDVGHRPLGDRLDERKRALPPAIAGHENSPGDERGLDERNDHAEEENERGGDGTSDLVQAPNRSDNAARLLVDHDLPKVFLQRCRDLRRELVEHALAQVAARAFDERDDCRVHHRLEHVHRVIGQSPLQHLWGELRDALARQDAANRQDRRKQSRNQETDGHDEHREHDQPGGSGGQRRGLVEQELLPVNNALVFLTRTSCARACGSSVPHSISQEPWRA